MHQKISNSNLSRKNTETNKTRRNTYQSGCGVFNKLKFQPDGKSKIAPTRPTNIQVCVSFQYVNGEMDETEHEKLPHTQTAKQQTNDTYWSRCDVFNQGYSHSTADPKWPQNHQKEIKLCINVIQKYRGSELLHTSHNF